ncbi:MAG TPA: hypothetical protein VLM79_20065 [Kofleriaceae bacterium]|nr:hypothetical protein [Kofleriaceae bacterium]
MITMPNNDQNIEAAVDNQETEQVASIKLDDVTGGWGWYGPGPGPGAYGGYWGAPGGFYGGPSPYNPYAAAAFDRRAAYYAARYPGWY